MPVVWWVAQRTVFGLEVRAVGEDPDAAFARGVDVIRVRSVATLLSGLLAGLGGAAITTALVGVFEPAITAGRGFIALIVIIMVRWSAWGVAVGSFAFGFADALGTNLRNIVSDSVPTEALQTIPFLVALIILIIGARRAPHAQVPGLQLRPPTGRPRTTPPRSPAMAPEPRRRPFVPRPGRHRAADGGAEAVPRSRIGARAGRAPSPPSAPSRRWTAIPRRHTWRSSTPTGTR